MNQIIQSLLFLNGVEREEVCEPNSNALSWKKAKEWLTEKLPELMTKYEIFGEKKGEFKKYQTINFCEKITSQFTQEEVDTYNPGLGKLFKWNKMAIEGRKTDITRRLALQKKAKEDREMKQSQFEERKKNREAFLEESRTKFKEDNADQIEAYNKYIADKQAKEAQEYGEEQASENEDEAEQEEPPTLPEFDEAEAGEKFDEENPEVEIPDEIIDDINNDWVLDEAETEALIAKYFADKSGD